MKCVLTGLNVDMLRESCMGSDDRKRENLICKMLGHKWTGCKCDRCGSVRDQDHNWYHCACQRCNKIRDTGHVWKGVNCQACLKVDLKRKECNELQCLHSQFSNDQIEDSIAQKCIVRCTYCGRIEFRQHSFVKKENSCFKTCEVCGYLTEPEHSWISTACGKKCSICGISIGNHDFRLDHSEVVYGTGKCGNVNKNDDYICNFCRTPEACFKYPASIVEIYKCSVCGEIKEARQ